MRKIIFSALVAALFFSCATPTSAQSKFKKFMKKVEKVVSDDSSQNSSGGTSSESSQDSKENKKPDITTPGRTISVDFYDAEAKDDDLYIDFSVKNSGAAMNLYRFLLNSVKDSKGKTYYATFTISGHGPSRSSLNVAIGEDDAVYVEMKIEGAAKQIVNLDFDLQNVGTTGTRDGNGKLLMKGVQATK